MKKILIIFGFFIVSISLSKADFVDSCNCNTVKNSNTDIEQNPLNTCENDCLSDDDEYCIYNECYLDKHFRQIKIKLLLSQEQENIIDSLYCNLKSDLETLYSNYNLKKNKILEKIDCNDNSFKKEINELKKIKRDIKTVLICFRTDVRNKLLKNQLEMFRKLCHYEKRKMKKIAKYGAIYKLPCVKCCN